ncbi:MAG: YHS domain-containing protein [Armatimonadota bacterium]
MRMHSIFFALAVAVLLQGAAFAKESKPSVGKAAVVTCPVTGRVVKNVKTAPKAVYQGKTYYFCCSECKPKFEKNPAKYIKGAQQKQSKSAGGFICPVMGTKVASIADAAGKSVYKGKVYYFCCPECKPKFDKNPEKYIHNKVDKAPEHSHSHGA